MCPSLGLKTIPPYYPTLKLTPEFWVKYFMILAICLMYMFFGIGIAQA